MNQEETVKCTLCGEQTPMLGTQLCDRCWELSKRIEFDPKLAIIILSEILNKRKDIGLLVTLCTCLNTSTKFANLLRNTEMLLKEAKEHLEYCGYGDSWERECAESLQKKLDKWVPTTIMED